MADTSYQTQVYRFQGAKELRIPSGTKINMETGSKVSFNSTQQAAISDYAALVGSATTSANSAATSDAVVMATKINSVLIAMKNAWMITS